MTIDLAALRMQVKDGAAPIVEELLNAYEALLAHQPGAGGYKLVPLEAIDGETLKAGRDVLATREAEFTHVSDFVAAIYHAMVSASPSVAEPVSGEAVAWRKRAEEAEVALRAATERARVFAKSNRDWAGLWEKEKERADKAEARQIDYAKEMAGPLPRGQVLAQQPGAGGLDQEADDRHYQIACDIAQKHCTGSDGYGKGEDFGTLRDDIYAALIQPFYAASPEVAEPDGALMNRAVTLVHTLTYALPFIVDETAAAKVREVLAGETDPDLAMYNRVLAKTLAEVEPVRGEAVAHAAEKLFASVMEAFGGRIADTAMGAIYATCEQIVANLAIAPDTRPAGEAARLALLEKAAQDIKDNPPYGSEFNRKYQAEIIFRELTKLHGSARNGLIYYTFDESLMGEIRSWLAALAAPPDTRQALPDDEYDAMVKADMALPLAERLRRIEAVRPYGDLIERLKERRRHAKGSRGMSMWRLLGECITTLTKQQSDADALDFYADERNWEGHSPVHRVDEPEGFTFDDGNTARRARKGEAE